MISRVALQPVFILHTRPFRDTSLLMDVLSMEYGRVSLLARGVRRARAPLRSILQPFVPLLMSWSGRGELLSMSQVEASSLPYLLKGNALVSGFYLNELIVRLLHRFDPHPDIYAIYQNALLGLQNNTRIAAVLRIFEKSLLNALGYGLEQAALSAESWYVFIAGKGLIASSSLTSENIFSGKNLLDFFAEILDEDCVLSDAKRLMRMALQALLGNRLLKSRELLI